MSLLNKNVTVDCVLYPSLEFIEQLVLFLKNRRNLHITVFSIQKRSFYAKHKKISRKIDESYAKRMNQNGKYLKTTSCIRLIRIATIVSESVLT